jgi:protein SERAC1
MASSKHRNTFRASNISNNTTKEHLKAELINKFTEEEKGIIKFDKLSLAPSCTNSGNTQTAIFKLRPTTPVFLSDLDAKPFQMLVNGKDVEIDQDFFGLTQLYPTTDGEIALE